MTKIGKRALVDAFKQIQRNHNWSKPEAAQLSIVRWAYEDENEEKFDAEYAKLMNSIEQKREALNELYRKLNPDVFGLKE